MRTLLLASVLALSGASGCSHEKTESENTESGEAGDHVPEMSPDQVEKELAANRLTAVDCNGFKLRKRHGVLPGAVLLEDEETFSSSELPADKTRKLVFYCSGPG